MLWFTCERLVQVYTHVYTHHTRIRNTVNNSLHQATQKETVYNIIKFTLQFGIAEATHVRTWTLYSLDKKDTNFWCYHTVVEHCLIDGMEPLFNFRK